MVVTGSTGMIGRQIVKKLCNMGADVICVSLDDIKTDHRAEFFFADLTDFSICRDLTKNADYVCHLAGIKSSVDVTKSMPASFFVPLLMMNTNI